MQSHTLFESLVFLNKLTEFLVHTYEKIILLKSLREILQKFKKKHYKYLLIF